MSTKISKEAGENLLAIATDSEKYGYSLHPLFDIDANEEQLKKSQLEAVLFVLLQNEALSIVLLAPHATKDSAVYLELASGLIPQQTNKKEKQTPLLFPKNFQLAQLPLTILLFYGTPEGSLYPILAVPRGSDAPALLMLLTKLAGSRNHGRTNPLLN